MYRFVEKELFEWKSSKRLKPLVIKGARQVGKTFSIKKFGEAEFKNFVSIDFERNRDIHSVFKKNLDVKRIISEFEIVLEKKIKPGETLLFFDEIQACPEALMSLRYFYEDLPDLHVIASGSLIEFSLQQISFPVGRIQFLTMYPLTFAEFLLATGKDNLAAIITSPPKLLPEIIHNSLMDEVRKYFFIGGMPECVKNYAELLTIQSIFEIQAELVETYRFDFAKYKPQADHQCLNGVLTAISRNIGHQIKYSSLIKGFSQPTIHKAFNLLSLASIFHRILSVNPSGLPLGFTESESIFKALLIDIGLMRYLSGMPVEIEYPTPDLLDIYKGAMAEQFVGQELIAATKNKLWYWRRAEKNSQAEVDYIIVKQGKPTPIEVKSGPYGKLKSMHLFLKQYPETPFGLVFSTAPYSELKEQKIIFLPIYYANCIGLDKINNY